MNLSKILILMLLCLSQAFSQLQAQEDPVAADQSPALDQAPEVDTAPKPNAAIKGAPAPREIKRMPRLTVKVTGLTPATGTAEISLFNSAESFMLKPFYQESGVPDENGTVEVRFLNVFEGEYGVVAVHDENGNGLYDAGFLGFGAEPVGYSNDASPWLGRPSFDEVKFDVQQDLTINISMD